MYFMLKKLGPLHSCRIAIFGMVDRESIEGYNVVGRIECLISEHCLRRDIFDRNLQFVMVIDLTTLSTGAI